MFKPLLALAAVAMTMLFIVHLFTPVIEHTRPHQAYLVGYGCVGHVGPVFTFGDEDTLPICKRIERK